MKITAYGPRYYPDEMNGYDAAVRAIETLNSAKRAAYDAWYWHSFPNGKKPDPLEKETLYDFIRSLGYGSLYANVIEPQAKGILKSQVTNRKNYVEDVRADLEKRREKLAGVEEELARKKAVKESMVTYAKTGSFPTPYHECRLSIVGGVVTGYGVDPTDWKDYERKVEADARKLKHRIAMIKEGVRRKEAKLSTLESLPPKRAIFGGRAAFAKKDSADASGWKEKFEFARSKSFVVSGRADSKNKNFLVKYSRANNNLEWTLPDGSVVTFPNFVPARHGAEFVAAFDGDGPVSYSFERRVDPRGKEFLLVKATFDWPEDGRVCDSLVDGCVAYDANYDRFAWAELDADGNVKSKGEIRFDLEGLTKEQAADALGRASAKLVAIAERTKKPLVREDLDAAAMRRGMKYENPKRNARISGFACEKMIAFVESRARRKGYAVLKVNPAYTSFQSKVLLVRTMGTSVHVGAAVMIGRRALDVLVNPPQWADPVIGKSRSITRRGIWNEWKKLYGFMKSTRAHAYYREIPVFEKKSHLKTWLASIAT